MERGFTIGEVARRTGLAVSAIRYYADQGLVHPVRSAGGRRQFRRADIRRVSFILIAQRLGFALADIRTALDTLPQGRTPNKADWARLSTEFRAALDDQIDRLKALRSGLDGCIGCGCLSLEACALYNPKDGAAAFGAGPRYLLGQSAQDMPPGDCK